MEKNSVADVLRGLAEGDKARSETARLRDVFEEVEAALDAGVSRAAVLEALHSNGFTMTLKSFESALYRIRRQRKKEGIKAGKEKPIERQKEGMPEDKPSSDSNRLKKKQAKRFEHNPSADGIKDLLGGSNDDD